MKDLEKEKIKEQYYIVWTDTKRYCSVIDIVEVEELFLDEMRRCISTFGGYQDLDANNLEDIFSIPFRKMLTDSLNKLLKGFPVKREEIKEWGQFPETDISIESIEPRTKRNWVEKEGKVSIEILEEIKRKSDIVDVISGYIKLKPAGKALKGLCPFHDEKTASFMVSQEKQLYHCFGCGEGGNVFNFIQKFEKVSFFEAVKILAKKAKINMSEEKNDSFSRG